MRCSVVSIFFLFYFFWVVFSPLCHFWNFIILLLFIYGFIIFYLVLSSLIGCRVLIIIIIIIIRGEVKITRTFHMKFMWKIILYTQTLKNSFFSKMGTPEFLRKYFVLHKKTTLNKSTIWIFGKCADLGLWIQIFNQQCVNTNYSEGLRVRGSHYFFST